MSGTDNTEFWKTHRENQEELRALRTSLRKPVKFPSLPAFLQDPGWDTVLFHVKHSEPVE